MDMTVFISVVNWLEADMNMWCAELIIMQHAVKYEWVVEASSSIFVVQVLLSGRITV